MTTISSVRFGVLPAVCRQNNILFNNQQTSFQEVLGQLEKLQDNPTQKNARHWLECMLVQDIEQMPDSAYWRFKDLLQESSYPIKANSELAKAMIRKEIREIRKTYARYC